jgi:hypothetical protein
MKWKQIELFQFAIIPFQYAHFNTPRPRFMHKKLEMNASIALAVKGIPNQEE